MQHLWNHTDRNCKLLREENCPSAILYTTFHINCPGIKPRPLHQEVGSSAHDLLTSTSW